VSAVLVLDPALAGDPAVPALAERLRLRGARLVVAEALTPRALLRAAAPDPSTAWLASADVAVAASAATAGLYGVVVIGIGEDADAGVLVRHAPDLAAATIAMVPRGGGCWHDQRR
jgi:hypothetical protein